MAFCGLPNEFSELNAKDAQNDLEKLFLHTTEAGVKVNTVGADELIGDFGLIIAKKFGGNTRHI